MRYKIIDRDTGKRVTIVSYPSAATASGDIDEWRKRHLRGRRPDITFEMIERMEVAAEDHDYS